MRVAVAVAAAEAAAVVVVMVFLDARFWFREKILNIAYSIITTI